MSREVVRAGFDSWAGSAKPSLEHPREASLRLDSGEAEAFLWFKSPAPRGATVTSATLTLRAKGASSGSRTLTVQRVTARWSESRLNWGNKPTATTSGQATASVGTLANGDSIAVNVTSIVQAWASGSANYGLRVTTSASAAHLIGSLNSTLKPTLTVVWSDAPAKPTNLRPSEAATSLAKPHVTFDYLDVSGDTSLAAVQVQTSTTSSFTSPAFDSGEVASTSAGLDLAETSFPGLAEGETVYWRVRAKDGAGLWSVWSDAVTMTRTSLAPLTLTSPSGGSTFDPTPDVAWTMSGQARYRVLLYKTTDLTRPIHDSGDRLGSAAAYTIPNGVVDDGPTYRVVVRGWDAAVREATPGDPGYASAQADFYLGTSPGVDPVATLTAAPVDLSPWVDLTWTRALAPNSFVILRDGKVIDTVDPADVLVSGSTYTYRYYGARPNRSHTYNVRAVEGTAQGPNGPSASLTTSPSGLWVVDLDRKIDVTLWGNEEGTWSMVDDASVYTPIGSTQVVRIVNGMRGLEGSLSGLLMSGFGKTFAQMETDVYAIKSRPTQTVRIIAGDENFEALIGNVRVSPKPETRQGEIVKGVSFDFWQVGALPFDAEI